MIDNGIIYLPCLSGYGRRRIIPRRMYPGVPIGRRIIDPYPGPIIDPYPRAGTFIDDGLYPDTGLGVIGGRRPAVISDRSNRNAQDINVSNNNVNREVNTGSNNVVVSQGRNLKIFLSCLFCFCQYS